MLLCASLLDLLFSRYLHYHFWAEPCILGLLGKESLAWVGVNDPQGSQATGNAEGVCLLNLFTLAPEMPLDQSHAHLNLG